VRRHSGSREFERVERVKEEKVGGSERVSGKVYSKETSKGGE
jgi:hypothetical protein